MGRFLQLWETQKYSKIEPWIYHSVKLKESQREKENHAEPFL